MLENLAPFVLTIWFGWALARDHYQQKLSIEKERQWDFAVLALSTDMSNGVGRGELEAYDRVGERLRAGGLDEISNEDLGIHYRLKLKIDELVNFNEQTLFNGRITIE